eukprot:scaffold79183_cov20-Phaeocystis_antarctica.AAC.1
MAASCAPLRWKVMLPSPEASGAAPPPPMPPPMPMPMPMPPAPMLSRARSACTSASLAATSVLRRSSSLASPSPPFSVRASEPRISPLLLEPSAWWGG